MHRFSLLVTVVPLVGSGLACAGDPRPARAPTQVEVAAAGREGPQGDERTVMDLPPGSDRVSATSCHGGEPPAPESVEVISPNAPVPDFQVATTDCRSLHSGRLIGPRPLVLVFFSSWCGVCDRKMPIIRRAQQELAGEATFIAVAVDDEDTWSHVKPFLARHDISMPLVRGDWFPRFSMGFNPFGSIPVVLVIGRDGRIIDLQLGYSPFDENRLIGAVELDRRRSGPIPSAPVEPDETAPEGGT